MRTAFVGAICVASSTAEAAPYHIHLSWQGPTATTMSVTWRSAKSTGAVQYGPTTGYGKTVTATSASFQGATLHVAQITGLKPGTSYHYRCGESGDWSGDHTFKTAPAPGTAYRYIAAGDSRDDDTNRAKVRGAMALRQPVFSLHTGDFVGYGPDQKQWDTYFKTMQPLLTFSPLMGTLGNHEEHASNYYDQFALPRHAPAKAGIPTEAYYSFDYATTHFIALSTEHSPQVGDHQYQWLRSDLIAAAKKPHIKWIVAFGHRPPYSSGNHGNDATVQSAWLHLFESFGVDVTFWGHDHIYERTKRLFQGRAVAKGGVTYIVTGGAGAPLYTVSGAYFTAYAYKDYHFVEINVQGDQMKLDARSPSGKIFDTLTLTKSGPKPTWIMDGALDPSAPSLGSGAGAELKKLHAKFDGRYLYLVASGQPTAKDHFIFISPKKPASLMAAPWGKAGQVWAAVDMLALESKNGWSNWQPPAGTQGKVINYGDVWKYHDKGVDLGTGWTSGSFNDSSWKSGPGQLGYGDGDEKTLLHDPDPNYPSVYFRKQFSLGWTPTTANLSVIHDDGVAVWVNGTKVLSKYMGNGTLYSAWASAESNDNQQTTMTIPLTAGAPFKKGQNTIAVMVKQYTATSSDISFDLQLDLQGDYSVAGSRASNPAGQVMEGMLDLKERYGAIPDSVYIAATAYGTNSGDPLSEQIPKGNGDKNLDPGEWVELKLKSAPKPDSGLPPDGGKPSDGSTPLKDGAPPAADGNLDGPDCDCRVAQQPAPAASPIGWLGLLALLVLRRRR